MLKKTLLTLTAAAAVTFAVAGASTQASAGMFNDRGLTTIWVSIHAFPHEGLWQACRRRYQHDVYKVRGGRGNTVRCQIDHSRVYEPGERYQNFN